MPVKSTTLVSIGNHWWLNVRCHTSNSYLYVNQFSRILAMLHIPRCSRVRHCVHTCDVYTLAMWHVRRVDVWACAVSVLDLGTHRIQLLSVQRGDVLTCQQTPTTTRCTGMYSYDMYHCGWVRGTHSDRRIDYLFHTSHVNTLTQSRSRWGSGCATCVTHAAVEGRATPPTSGDWKQTRTYINSQKK